MLMLISAKSARTCLQKSEQKLFSEIAAISNKGKNIYYMLSSPEKSIVSITQRSEHLISVFTCNIESISRGFRKLISE